MNYIKFLAFVKYILRFSIKYPKKIINSIWQPSYNLAYLFSNKSKYWTSIGRDLYENEQVFRETVQQCDQIIVKISNLSILSNFEGDPDDGFFENEANVGFTVTTIQIALFELYKSKNILPDYISGISLGEFAAVYAAGGLTLEESLKLTYCAINLLEVEKREYVSLFAFADLERVTALCNKSQLWVVPLIHIDVNTVLLYCHVDDLAEVSNYFSSQHITCKKPNGEPYWPFHTELIDKHKFIVDRFVKDIKPRPINCNYYSATYGTIIPQHSIIPAGYWYDMLRKPVLFHDVILMLKPLKNLVLLTVGPNFALRTVVQNLLSYDMIYLDSMTYNTPALQTFKSVYRSLRNLSIDKRKSKPSAPANEDIGFKKQSFHRHNLLETP